MAETNKNLFGKLDSKATEKFTGNEDIRIWRSRFEPFLTCQIEKGHPPAANFGAYISASKPEERVHLDYWGMISHHTGELSGSYA